MKKGKTPLPPSGIPDPEHPRLLKDGGNAEVYNAHFVFTHIRVNPLFHKQLKSKVIVYLTITFHSLSQLNLTKTFRC